MKLSADSVFSFLGVGLKMKTRKVFYNMCYSILGFPGYQRSPKVAYVHMPAL